MSLLNSISWSSCSFFMFFAFVVATLAYIYSTAIERTREKAERLVGVLWLVCTPFVCFQTAFYSSSCQQIQVTVSSVCHPSFIIVT